MSSPTTVQIVEVSPRDGLQNEKRVLSTSDKVELVRRAAQTGVQRVEVTSFVRPDRVPQLADAAGVCAALGGIDIVASALALNLHGYERAVATGIREVNAVVICTDTFSNRNQGMPTADSVEQVRRMRERAAAEGVAFSVTVAASFGCPFEGEVSDERFADVLTRVVDIGPDEIALADTIGVGVPPQVEDRFGLLQSLAPATPMRVHLHDTRNTAVANAVAAARSGVTVFDASLGGIGGCPFAADATGNVATEDLVYLFDRMGIVTGVDLGEAIAHAEWITGELGVPITGRVAKVGGFPARER